MKHCLKLTAWVASAVIALSSLPAGAMSLPVVPQQIQNNGNLVDAQYYRNDRHKNYRHDRHRSNRHNPGHWNGYRGYHGPRHGYRRHSDGWWYPLAAFGIGAAIGGAVSAPPARHAGNAHYRWCEQRYKTYRASDNTYVPRAGVRARCVSPYGR